MSLRSHAVQFMNDSGDALASFSVPNDLNGAETLLQRSLHSADREDDGSRWRLTDCKIT